MQALLNYIKYPSRLCLAVVKHTHLLYSDSLYLRLYYFFKMGKVLHLNNPKTFNEKIQWLKIHDKRPEYTIMVDKYAVKQLVSDIIGNEHIIPTLGVWNNPKEIDWDKLPQQFVLKSTHSGGGDIIICENKDTINRQSVVNKLKKSLNRSIFSEFREWPYKNVPRRIIAEQYMAIEGESLDDYKVFCFNGEPKLILLCRNRFSRRGMTEDFYTTKWEHLNLKRPNCDNPGCKSRPEELDEMLSLAADLSKSIPFVRTDFYIINHMIYFGELTFYPASGMSPFVPQEWDDILGSYLCLPLNEKRE